MSFTLTAGGTQQSRTKPPTEPYRIGQTKDVQVRKLVCDGTIEERIDDIIAHKSTMSDLVVGTGETWLTELDDDQLQELFRLEVK